MKIKQKQPVRGEVYLCQFDPVRGSERNNRFGAKCIFVSLTLPVGQSRQVPDRPLSWNVLLFHL